MRKASIPWHTFYRKRVEKICDNYRIEKLANDRMIKAKFGKLFQLFFR